MLPLRAHIDLYFDSWENIVRQNIVVYGKGAKNEAYVISYFLITSEWHPCAHFLCRSAECTERQRQSVFYQPYAGNETAGNQSDQVKGLVDRLQGNQTVRSAVDRVETLYAEKKESLVHGDLSLSNVTMKDGKPKVCHVSPTPIADRPLVTL